MPGIFHRQVGGPGPQSARQPHPLSWGLRLQPSSARASDPGPMGIEDPAVIKRILAHLDNRQGAGQHPEHPPRAPPLLAQPGLTE